MVKCRREGGRKMERVRDKQDGKVHIIFTLPGAPKISQQNLLSLLGTLQAASNRIRASWWLRQMGLYLESELCSCRHEFSYSMMPPGTQALSAFPLSQPHSVGFCAHVCHLTVLGSCCGLTHDIQIHGRNKEVEEKATNNSVLLTK